MVDEQGEGIGPQFGSSPQESSVVVDAGANGEAVVPGTQITTQGLSELQTATTGSASGSASGSAASGSWNPIPMEDFLYQSGIPELPAEMYENEQLKVGLGSVGLAPKGDKVVNDNSSGASSILINSDRVILNSRTDHTRIAGAKGVALTSKAKVNIDADETVTVFGTNGIFLGVPNKGAQPKDYPPLELKTNPAFFKEGKKLKSYPTEDAPYEPLVLGSKLVNWLDDLLVVIKNMQILTNTGLATAREDAQWDFVALQSRLPELISNYIYLDGYSHEVPDFGSVPAPPDKVTKPPTSIDVNLSLSIQNPTAAPAVGAVTSPNANKPGYYEGTSPTIPSLAK